MWGTGPNCDKCVVSLYTEIGLQKCGHSWAGKGENLENVPTTLVMPPGIESLDLFHILSLSCSLETLEVPWLIW